MNLEKCCYLHITKLKSKKKRLIILNNIYITTHTPTYAHAHTHTQLQIVVSHYIFIYKLF